MTLTAPKTVQERLEILLRAEVDEDFRHQVIEKAKQDDVFFINTFCFTFDPREDVDVNDQPFILYPFQERYVHWLNSRIDPSNPKSGLVEKSRDMGVTWVTISWAVKKWRYEPGFVALFGSRVEELVDNRTIESLFGMMEYVIERLPWYILPEGWNPDQHRRFMKIENPENGNYLLGGAASPNFGRGSRARIVIMDEGASWPDLKASWMSASYTSRSRVIISTPKGMNFFGQLRWETGIEVYTIHWREHPKKDDAWYEQQKTEFTPDIIAQELDISYQTTTTGLVYPHWQQVPKGDFPYQRGWPLFVSWDFGIGDDTAMIWWQQDPVSGRFRMIDAYHNNNKAIDFYVPFAKGIIPSDDWHEYVEPEVAKISIHGAWRGHKAIHYGDPDVNKRSLVTGTSPSDVLRQNGIYVVTRNTDFWTRKTATDLGLRNLDVNIPSEPGPVGCWDVDRAMTNAAFPEPKPDSRKTDESRPKPYHDWTSHYRTAVEFFFVNAPPVYRRSRPKSYRRRAAYRDI